MIFPELSNAVFRFVLRCAQAEIEGFQTPPISHQVPKIGIQGKSNARNTNMMLLSRQGHQGQLSRSTPQIDFLYLFMERWCVARSRNHHQSKARVKLQVGLSSEFSLRSPKVNYQGKHQKSTLYLFTEMVRCMFSQPPPIERAGQTPDGSFLRILIQIT